MASNEVHVHWRSVETLPEKSGSYTILWVSQYGYVHVQEINYSAKWKCWNYFDSNDAPTEDKDPWSEIRYWTESTELIPAELQEEIQRMQKEDSL